MRENGKGNASVVAETVEEPIAHQLEAESVFEEAYRQRLERCHMESDG